MKLARRVATVLGAAVVARGANVSPVGKAISMLTDLKAKVIAEGEVAQKTYDEFSEWCEDRARDLGHEIKTGKSEVESSKAAIAEEVATSQSLSAKIEELAANIATDEADLKSATTIRESEVKDFSAEEAELTETIDMLKRAHQVLASKASLVQLQGATDLTRVVQVLVSGSFLGSEAGDKLQSFIQASAAAAENEGEDELDKALGAPQAAAYESKSGSVVDTLEDLLEKAETQLSEARKKETEVKHNFEMLKQSLEDEIKFAKKDLAESKKAMAASAEKKATAEGDLETTSKELSADVEAKEALHHDCMTKAENFEAEVKSRGEEVAALTKAKQVIQEATGGGALAQLSFLQRARARLATRADLKHLEAVRVVRELAKKDHSSALAQLASRMSAAIRVSGTADPFAKIRGMISDMLEKLEKEAGEEADKKAWCDKETAETTAKKSDKSDDIEKLSTKIEQMTAKSAKLKEDVAALEASLASLAKAQAEMDKIRAEEKAAFTENKAEQEKGLEGIRVALQVLKDYYSGDSAHGSAGGAASGIVGLLETVESSMSKELAEISSTEETAAADYEQLTQENALEKTTKEQDVKYKAKESAQLDKTSSELSSDRSGIQEELDAVLEYLAQLNNECIAKAETYEERKARREQELAGLKEALSVLDGETALVQRRSFRRVLRGSRQASLQA